MFLNTASAIGDLHIFPKQTNKTFIEIEKEKTWQRLFKSAQTHQGGKGYNYGKKEAYKSTKCKCVDLITKTELN
jgi:hypothetical protein